MVVLAGLHVVSRDFLDEFPCSGIRVIHKISINSRMKEVRGSQSTRPSITKYVTRNGLAIGGLGKSLSFENSSFSFSSDYKHAYEEKPQSKVPRRQLIF